MLEKSSMIAETMYNAILESAKPGTRECEVYANMLQAAIKNGGEEDMIWLSAGQLRPPHAKKPPPSFRKLEKGDIIVTEFHSNYQGYLSGIEHSISLGKPKQEFVKIHQVCIDAQNSGIESMKTGVLLNKVIDAFRKPIIDAGMSFVECGFHGHGLASPEFPSCMYGGHAGQWEWHPYAIVPPIRLTENMVFGTAADVFDPKWNQKTGLMLGDPILITKEGPRKLTKVPFELTLV
jgi:Xaa-Pro aminopeptidase